MLARGLANAGIAGQARQRDQPFERVGVALVHVGLERRVALGVVVAEAAGGVERGRVAGRRVVVEQTDQAAAHAEPFLVVGGRAVGAEAAVRLLVADQALRHAADAVLLAGVAGEERHRADPAAGVVGAPVPDLVRLVQLAPHHLGVERRAGAGSPAGAVRRGRRAASSGRDRSAASRACLLREAAPRGVRVGEEGVARRIGEERGPERPAGVRRREPGARRVGQPPERRCVRVARIGDRRVAPRRRSGSRRRRPSGRSARRSARTPGCRDPAIAAGCVGSG